MLHLEDEARTTFWRLWGGDPPRVIATYRVSTNGGMVEYLGAAGWVEVPGETIHDRIANADAMLDRLTPLEAAALPG